MNCPVCDEKLRESNRHGVDIDICPACKGVWLDRGELDKIINLVSGETSERYDSRESSTESKYASDSYRDSDKTSYDDSRDHKDSNVNSHKKPRKREGLLGEIFDIFG